MPADRPFDDDSDQHHGCVVDPSATARVSSWWRGPLPGSARPLWIHVREREHASGRESSQRGRMHLDRNACAADDTVPQPHSIDSTGTPSRHSVRHRLTGYGSFGNGFGLCLPDRSDRQGQEKSATLSAADIAFVSQAGEKKMGGSEIDVICFDFTPVNPEDWGRPVRKVGDD